MGQFTKEISSSQFTVLLCLLIRLLPDAQCVLFLLHLSFKLLQTSSRQRGADVMGIIHSVVAEPDWRHRVGRICVLDVHIHQFELALSLR